MAQLSHTADRSLRSAYMAYGEGKTLHSYLAVTDEIRRFQRAR